MKSSFESNSFRLVSRTCLVSVVLFFGSFVSAASYTAPDPAITPGVLCTAADPNFSGLAYPEQIPKCNRNVNDAEKIEVANLYGGIPRTEWKNYEFDHLIPLCAGGSDDPKNLWPQPIGPAHEKDKIEVDVCIQLRAGTMTQVAAVQKIRDWVLSQQTLPAIDPSLPAATPEPVVSPPPAAVFAN